MSDDAESAKHAADANEVTSRTYFDIDQNRDLQIYFLATLGEKAIFASINLRFSIGDQSINDRDC